MSVTKRCVICNTSINFYERSAECVTCKYLYQFQSYGDDMSFGAMYLQNKESGIYKYVSAGSFDYCIKLIKLQAFL